MCKVILERRASYRVDRHKCDSVLQALARPLTPQPPLPGVPGARGSQFATLIVSYLAGLPPSTNNTVCNESWRCKRSPPLPCVLTGERGGEGRAQACSTRPLGCRRLSHEARNSRQEYFMCKVILERRASYRVDRINAIACFKL